MILSKTKNLFFLFLFLIVLNINFIFAEICPEGVNPCNPEIPFQNLGMTNIIISSSGSTGSGNPFDQSLNTTDNVRFNQVTLDTDLFLSSGSYIRFTEFFDLVDESNTANYIRLHGTGTKPGGFILFNASDTKANVNLTGSNTLYSYINLLNSTNITADSFCYRNGTCLGTGGGTGGNSSWNQSFANTLYYNISNPLNYLNATTISNSTIVRANTYNCPNGFIVQNITANRSGVFGVCVNSSSVGINYWGRFSGTGFNYVRPNARDNILFEDTIAKTQIIIGTNPNAFTGYVPYRNGISFNGSESPPSTWLQQGYHPTYFGKGIAMSINSKYNNNINYSHAGVSFDLDARGTNGLAHIYTYQIGSGTENLPFEIDDDNNIILQSNDYNNNGDVWIGNNSGFARFVVQSKDILACNGTLDCSGYDEATCQTKTEGCSTDYICEGTHNACDSYDGTSVATCSSHGCSYTESCTGSLDCSIYGDFDCGSHSGQCSWDGMNCNTIGSCGAIGTEGDCNSYNGCSWYIDCYGDPHTCQQSECDASSDGCYNTFSSCSNSATCSDITFANCNDYNGCNQTYIFDNKPTSEDRVGFGQTANAYNCVDNAGITQTYFDYTCSMTTQKPLIVLNNINITGNASFGEHVSIKKNLTVTGNIEVNGNIHINGNFSAKRPYWNGYDNSTQTNPSTSAINIMNISNNNDYDSYLISVQGKQNLTFQQTGDYLCILSPEFTNTATTATVGFWYQKTNSTGNFNDVAWSNSRYTISNGEYLAPAIPFQFDIENITNDKIRFMWYSSSTNTQLISIGGLTSPTRPGVPAVILNCQKISEIT